mmetsp:Transcript_33568/g.65347  ORF Transcript_33568/g.65347 Transcript_33568/m.65347 type:complete len:213 (+) Transcript_33568:2-640(+)
MTKEATKTTLDQSSIIVVEGAGANEMNGEYTRASDDSWGRPIWTHKTDSQYQLWWENNSWMLGRRSKYYIVHSDAKLPPLKGWQRGHSSWSLGAIPTIYAKDAPREVNIPFIIMVENAGDKSVNGEYKRAGSYSGKPQWNKTEDPAFYVWYRPEDGGHWRIGKTNDYYYICPGATNLPPESGWEVGKEAFGGRYTWCPNNAGGPVPTTRRLS